METIADTLSAAARCLATRSDSPRLDAELLLGKVLACSRTALVIRAADPLTEDRRRAFADLIAQRLGGAPVAYLTGSREFWSLRLAVTPDVLVPRSDTETLVELALQRLPTDQASAVLDLGTGSGAIALAIASERPKARVTGVDVSGRALDVARINARNLGLSHVDWREGSWFDQVSGQRFDLIVANPPYVAADDPALLELAAEPTLALTSGPTGLEAFHVIIAQAAGYLKESGWLMLEHGNTQAPAVATLFRDHGFYDIRSYVDCGGNVRVTLGNVHSTH